MERYIKTRLHRRFGKKGQRYYWLRWHKGGKAYSRTLGPCPLFSSERLPSFGLLTERADYEQKTRASNCGVDFTG